MPKNTGVFQMSAMLSRLAALCLLVIAFAPPALAQAPSVTLQDLRYSLGFVNIHIPRLDVRGSPLSQAELRTLLDPASPGNAVDRIQRLQAQSAEAPEVIVEQDVGGARSRTVYRDVRISGLANGEFGEVTSASMAGETSDPKTGTVVYRNGLTRVEGLDVGQIARLIFDSSANPERTEMRPAYRSLSYQDMALRLPQEMGEITLARVTARGFKGRPGREPLDSSIRAMIDFFERQKDARPNTRPSPQDMLVIGRFFEIFGNFEYGVMDMEGFRGRVGAGAEAASFEIAAMRFSDQAQSPGLAIRDMRVEAGPARFVMAELEARDYGIRDMFRALADILQSGDPTAIERQWQRLIPKIGTLRIAGLDIVAPDPDARPRGRQSGPQQPPAQAQTLRITAKSMELGFANQIDGVPTAMKLGADELVIPLSANSRDENVRNMRAMGLTSVNLSWLADLAWRQDRNVLDITALNLGIKDQLSASISGRLGNVTREAFSTDTALAQVAWLSATAQQLKINVRNSGLIERFIETTARRDGKSPEALRREWGTIAAVGLPALLGSSDGARAISGAIARFLARPGAIEIEAASRSPSGVGVADAVMAMGDPQGLFDKLEIRASAQ